MNRPYLLLFANGTLFDRHLTRKGALKHQRELASKGTQVYLAYAPQNLKEDSNG